MTAEQYSVVDSFNFFGDPTNYRPLTRTADGGNTVICIDPMSSEMLPGDGDHGRIVAAQTDGGAAGRAIDITLLITATLENPSSIDRGMRHAAGFYPKDKSGVHADCKYVGGIRQILAEMEKPSEPTQQAMGRWADRLGYPTREDAWRKVSIAAGHLLRSMDGDATLDRFARVQRPKGYFVYGVHGECQAGVYVANLASGMGLHRGNRPTGPKGNNIQAYVNSIGTSLQSLIDIPEGKLHRANAAMLWAATLLRAAATRTVITERHTEARYLEVLPAGIDSVRTEEVGF